MATKKCSKSVSESAVSFEFAHGTSHTVELADFSEDIITNLALHGLSQKLGDSYAGAETSEEAEKLFSGVVERLRAGDWKAQRESTGSSGTRTTQLARAVAVATGRDLAECAEMLAGKSADEQKVIRQHPDVAAALAKMKAEAAAAKAEEAAKAAGDAPALEL